MLLRTLLIEIRSKYDNSGLADASDDVEDLGEEAIKTSKAVDKLDDELDDAAREADKLGRETRQAARGVDKLGDQAQQTGRQVGRMDKLMSQAATSVAALGPALAAAGLAALVQGVGQAIAFVGEKTAELDSIAKRAQQTGFATDDYQRLAQVATLSGSNIDGLTKSVGDLNVRLAESARTGSGPAKVALDELGLSFADLQGKTPTDQLKVLSEAIRVVPNEADKARLAFQLMGEQGRALIPLFNGGAESIDGMVDSIDRIFTREELAEAEAYQDALANLNATTSALKGELALGAVPALQAVAEFLREIIPPASKVAAGIGEDLGPAVTRLVEKLDELGIDAGPGVIRWLKFIVSPLTIAADTVAFFANRWVDVIEIGEDVVAWLDELLGMVETRFPRAIELAGRAVSAMLSPLDTARDVIADILDFLERSFSEVDAIASRVRQIRATLGVGDSGEAVAPPAGATQTPNTGAGAAAQATTRLRAREAQVRRRLESERSARQAQATATARAPRRGRGGGGGGRGGAAPPAEEGILDLLGMTEPGAVMATRPAPETLTVVVSTVIEIAKGMTFNLSAPGGVITETQAREAAGRAQATVAASLEQVAELIRMALRTQVKGLQAAAGGGRRQPGAG